jgi:hypothetical protein
VSDIEIRVADLTVLNLEPGDTILLKTQRYFDEDEYDRVARKFRELFPGHELLVLEGGAEFAVLRPVADGTP